MIKIQKFAVNPLQENCYVVSDETKECVIIDCGAFTEEEFKDISDYISAENLKPVHMLLTHGHFDHISGCKMVFDAYGLKPEIHNMDAQLYKNFNQQAEAFMGMPMMFELPAIEKCFKNGDKVAFGSHEFKVHATPGHTPGGVFFVCDEEKVAFSGDTLFCGSIGRTDFPGGSMFQIINSLRYVAQMDDALTVYPGHGPETTLGDEVAHNPYMDR